MRAWVQRDSRALKAVTASDFILLVGSKPPVILDQKSWLEAATKRWLCTSFRFGDIYVRKVGSVALFTSQLDLKATIDGQDWSGTYWVADLWRMGRVRRGWRMAQRVVSRIDDNPELPGAVRQLQLWKSGPR
jgi:ketosteroid isomerase-like protein